MVDRSDSLKHFQEEYIRPAVIYLAEGQGKLRNRLKNIAISYVAHWSADDFPEEMEQDFIFIWKSLCEGEDGINGAISRMSVPKSKQVARALVLLFEKTSGYVYAEGDKRFLRVSFDNDAVSFIFQSGRQLIRPLECFPRLLGATPDQRNNWHYIGQGQGLHWPELDEDISVASLLR